VKRTSGEAPHAVSHRPRKRFGQHFLVDRSVVDRIVAAVAPQAGFADLDRIKARWPSITRFRLHLHDQRGLALTSIYAAITTLGPEDELEIDSTVGGIGGCPFAPRATGNIATDDLVYLLHGEGIETGIDLGGLISVAEWLEGILGRQLEGQVYRAGAFAPVAA